MRLALSFSIRLLISAFIHSIFKSLNYHPPPQRHRKLPLVEHVSKVCVEDMRYSQLGLYDQFAKPIPQYGHELLSAARGVHSFQGWAVVLLAGVDRVGRLGKDSTMEEDSPTR